MNVRNIPADIARYTRGEAFLIAQNTALLRVGIDLGGTKIEGIALDGSREVARVRVNTPRDDYEATLDAIAAVVSEVERQAGAMGGAGAPP